MEEGMSSNKGKQKIEMKKIEDNRARHVTFSKRKSGINKKASEIVTLCGANVDILMFSPTGKPYRFKEPSSLQVQSVEGGETSRVMEEQRNTKMEELLDQIDAEKEKEIELHGISNELRGTCWVVKAENLTWEWDQANEINQYFEELQEKLINEICNKERYIASNHGEDNYLDPLDVSIEELLAVLFPTNDQVYYGNNLDALFSSIENTGDDGVNFSPSYNYEGGTPFISEVRNENEEGTSGNEGIVTSSPPNQYQEANLFLVDDDDDDDFSFPPING